VGEALAVAQALPLVSAEALDELAHEMQALRGNPAARMRVRVRVRSWMLSCSNSWRSYTRLKAFGHAPAASEGQASNIGGHCVPRLTFWSSGAVLLGPPKVKLPRHGQDAGRAIG
jgi:hypothetical protein